MTKRLPLAMSALLAVAISLCTCLPAAAQVSDDEVAKAIDRIKAYLYKNQGGEGSWEHLYTAGHVGEGGATVIAVTALLASGESGQNPKLLKAINWLRKRSRDESSSMSKSDPDGKTYVVGLRAHVWGGLPDEYRRELEKEAEWLIGAAQKDATYNYGWDPKGSRYDHSNTQYGILGLWEAAKRGIHISEGFWDRVIAHHTKAQLADGGWNYVAGQDRPSYLAMTSAGLTAMLTARQELYPKEAPDKVNAVIDKGLAWIDKHYNPGDSLYSLYGIERVALASGVRFLNGRDWYLTGAQAILRREGGNGQVGNLPDTCFALMFLARGRHPVWVTKLEIPDMQWNRRPNDIYFLNHNLSDQREGELNWQTMSINRPVDDLLTTPLAYLSTPGEITLTDEQKAKLKQYLELGGMLVINPEGSNPSIDNSIKALMGEMFPQWKMRPLPADHPVFRSWHQLAGTPDSRGIQALGNGARELVIVTNRDWGNVSYAATGERQRNPAWLLAANVFALATERGVLNMRLVPRVLTLKGDAAASEEVTIGRAKYEGNWLPEPGAWDMQSRFMINERGIGVKTEDVELANLSGTGLSVVHLTGSQKVTLKQEQIDAIVNFTRAGGTVLVETVGGAGNFARGVEEQLEKVFNKTAVELASSEPLLSGEGVKGAFDVSRVGYRRHAIVAMAVKHRPRLAAFYIDGEAGQNRPAVIISNEDLSLGMLGVSHWGILGYSIDSSRQIMTNVALRAK